MTKRTLVLSTLLWSSFCLTAKAEIVFTDSYTLAHPQASVKQGSEVVVSDMPKVRNQDSLGICYACTATTLAQKQLCDADVSLKGRCDQLKESETLSMLSFALGHYDNENSKPAFKFNFNNGGHTYLSLQFKILEALKNHEKYKITFYPTARSEQCGRFDQFANNFGTNQAAVEAYFAKLKSLYELNKKHYKIISETEAKSECQDCLDQLATELRTHFNISKKTDFLQLGLKTNNFEEFLAQTLFENVSPVSCKNINLAVRNIGLYPTKETTPKDLSSLQKSIITKGVEILKQNKPFSLDGFCTQKDNVTQQCVGKHSTIISGYKEVCHNGQCTQLFKVHNCYGQDWQNANNDGWVSAEKLINHKETTMTWLE